ncbi:MAG: PKD domain-containing protein [Vicinamibacterales bacterium]
MSRPARTFLICCLLATATACDKVPLLAPTSSTITLTVNTTSVPINGTATVTASVTESAGTPTQNGTVVTFTSSFGTMEPSEARTEGGKATAIFRASTQSGTAKIGAFSGATRATEVDLLVGGAAAERIAVRAEPATVPKTGGTVELIAIVTDAAGNPLPGAPVIFTADNGTLASNSGVTNQNGVVTTTLTTNRQTVVHATVAAKDGTVTVNTVDLPTVTVTTSATSPAVGSPIPFTVTPGVTATGNPIQNVTVDFGDGSAATSLGAITAATGVSHIFNTAGSYTVRATVTDTTGQASTSSVVIVVQRPVITLTLTGPTTAITAGSTAVFSVNATTAAGNPPIASVLVTFPDGTSLTVGAGSSTFTRTFQTPGTYIVRATATDQAGTTATASTSVLVQSRAAITVTLDATYVGSSPTVANLNCVPLLTFPKTCTVNLETFFLTPQVRLQFSTTATVGAGQSIASYTWNFGDGSSSTTSNPSVDKVYFSRGTFIVTVTATTTDGATGTQQLTLAVQ